ncbi:small proline-rich protein 4 [Camelus ferus]|uniref:Small proline-rich protein 4 n=1 Tax=Camelus ferus TaxID=419612 RepID=A0A8B8RSJ1_CAMFR|nr:small proline-rich protein 4 [Camelus ferus]
MEVQRRQVAQGCAWQWQEQRRRPPWTAQQQQVKQPCQPPPVKCQETCAPQTKNPCAPKAKKQCPPKGAAIPAQPKCPSAQQAPKSKQK